MIKSLQHITLIRLAKTRLETITKAPRVKSTPLPAAKTMIWIARVVMEKKIDRYWIGIRLETSLRYILSVPVSV